MTPPQFLVVEDDPLVADSVRLVLERLGSVEVVSTIADARVRLESGSPERCLVIDVGLPDGSGLDLVQEQRTALERVNVLVLTGMFDRALVNRAATLGAHLALKPISSTSLNEVLSSLEQRRGSLSDARAKVVEQQSIRWKLTPREKEIVELHVEGKTREEIVRALGISSKTYANHVTSILTKTELASMNAVTIRLLLEVQQSSSAT